MIKELRCEKCNKLLGKRLSITNNDVVGVDGSEVNEVELDTVEIKCSRCSKLNVFVLV